MQELGPKVVGVMRGKIMPNFGAKWHALLWSQNLMTSKCLFEQEYVEVETPDKSDGWGDKDKDKVPAFFGGEERP